MVPSATGSLGCRLTRLRPATPYDGEMAIVTKPRVTSFRPHDLVSSTLSGKIRIPAFQRPFRWDKRDVVRLFDSIYRGYPIGNLLMWERPAPAAVVRIGPLRIHAAQVPDALWVVDGQQRITSLVGTLGAPPDTGDPQFRVFFDLRSQSFVSAGRREHIPDNWLPMPVALRNQDVLRWQRERPWLSDEDLEACDAVVSAIRDYEIPTYVVQGDDEQALREIFDRLNTFGMRLRREEVFEALHAVAPGMEPSGLRALSADVRGFGFGEFSESVLMQAVLAIRGDRIDRDFRGEFTSGDDRHKAFVATQRSLGHVIDFLREGCGIPHQRLLPYSLYVPVLARFVALFGAPEDRPAQLLRRWVWRGSVIGPAPEGNTIALRRYAAAVHDDALASANRLLGLLPVGGESWEPNLKQMGLNSAHGKLNVLALLEERPRVLLDGNYGAYGDLVDIKELLDQGINPLAEIIPREPTLAARIVHPPRAARQLSAVIASGGLEAEFLRSQCMDARSAEALALGDIEAFLGHRALVISDRIKHNVQRNALFGFRDGPDPASLFGDDSLFGDVSKNGDGGSNGA